MRKCEQREHILKITKMNPGIRLIYKMPTGKKHNKFNSEFVDSHSKVGS